MASWDPLALLSEGSASEEDEAAEPPAKRPCVAVDFAQVAAAGYALAPSSPDVRRAILFSRGACHSSKLHFVDQIDQTCLLATC